MNAPVFRTSLRAAVAPLLLAAAGCGLFADPPADASMDTIHTTLVYEIDESRVWTIGGAELRERSPEGAPVRLPRRATLRFEDAIMYASGRPADRGGIYAHELAGRISPGRFAFVDPDGRSYTAAATYRPGRLVSFPPPLRRSRDYVAGVSGQALAAGERFILTITSTGGDREFARIVEERPGSTGVTVPAAVIASITDSHVRLALLRESEHAVDQPFGAGTRLLVRTRSETPEVPVLD